MSAIFTWNPFGFLGLLTGTMVIGMAWLVYHARPDRAQNRRLALVLLLEGLIACTGTGLMFLSVAPEHAFAFQGITVMAMLAMGFLYLRFIATLDTPVARPLRAPWVDRLLVALAVLVPFTWVAAPDFYVAAMLDVWFVPWELLPGPGWIYMFVALAAIYLFGFVAAVSAYLRTPKESARRRPNRFMAIAIGWRDIVFSFSLIGPIFIPGLTYDTRYGGLFWAAGPATTQIVFVPLLAYAILKAQVFDIDLKIKIAVRRSTVAAIFAVAFFVGSEVVEGLMEVDGTWAGLAAAGLVALGFGSVQRVAARLTDRLFPRVEATPDYLDDRKIDVYRAALEGAFTDGSVTTTERDMLERLRTHLGIDPATATRLEAGLGLSASG